MVVLIAGIVLVDAGLREHPGAHLPEQQRAVGSAMWDNSLGIRAILTGKVCAHVQAVSPCFARCHSSTAESSIACTARMLPDMTSSLH